MAIAIIATVYGLGYHLNSIPNRESANSNVTKINRYHSYAEEAGEGETFYGFSLLVSPPYSLS
jgi:hypothetical protein